MNEKQEFEKMDEAWMQKLEGARQKRVPDGLLTNFSASVEARLEERAAKKAAAWPSALRARVWAPAFAVLLFASLVVMRWPGEGGENPALFQPLQMATASAYEIEDEINTLEELGVWSVEDEIAADVSSIESDLSVADVYSI